MKLQILSDVHTEFHRDGGISFFKELKVKGNKVILAGDIFGNIEGAHNVFEQCADKFEDVLYVAGNHEFYGHTHEQAVDYIREAAKHLSNVHVLNRDVVVLDGQRFVGCTMWYARDPMSALYEKYMADFEYIKDGGRPHWAYREGDLDVSFLEKNTQKGDVVITHLLPSRKSVHRIFDTSVLNRFFVRDQTGLIHSAEPAIWIHGHTHFSFDYFLGKTNIVCNPFGYVGVPMGLNKEFKEDFCVDI